MKKQQALVPQTSFRLFWKRHTKGGQWKVKCRRFFTVPPPPPPPPIIERAAWQQRQAAAVAAAAVAAAAAAAAAVAAAAVAAAAAAAAVAAAEDAFLLQQAAAMSLIRSQNQHQPTPAPLSAKEFWREATRLGARDRFGEWVKVAELVMVMVPGSVEDERVFREE